MLNSIKKWIFVIVFLITLLVFVPSIYAWGTSGLYVKEYNNDMWHCTSTACTVISTTELVDRYMVLDGEGGLYVGDIKKDNMFKSTTTS